MNHAKNRGQEALPRFINQLNRGDYVADIGSGNGYHADIMESHGLNVVRFDMALGKDYLNEAIVPGVMDGIWCCHVAEHILDLHKFLKKINTHLKDSGVIAITVPPPKNQIVGGHVNLFNPGLLLYRLVLSGFDCSHAIVGCYGYNISVIVKKQPIEMPDLVYDAGDIQKLAKYFPFPIDGDGFDGFSHMICNIDW
jgi:SAM-dependent methyltransferase